MGTAVIPPWRIKVHSFEACNCNTGRGCRFGGLPDYGSCEAMHAFEVIEGHYGSVDLAGLRAVIAAKWPKAVFEGHGQAVLFVDASAPPDHVDAAWMIFSGRAGSRLWTWYASTFEVFEGPLRVPIEMTVNGRRSHVRIPEQLEVGLVPLRHRVSGAEREVHIVYPAGTGGFWDDGNIATTTTMRVNHGTLAFQHKIDLRPMPWRSGPISRKQPPWQEDRRTLLRTAAGDSARACGHAEVQELV